MKTLEQQLQYERDTNRYKHECYCIMDYDEWKVYRNDRTDKYYVHDLVQEEWYEVKLAAELMIEDNNISVDYLGISRLGGKRLDTLIANNYFGARDIVTIKDSVGAIYTHYMWFEIINE